MTWRYQQCRARADETARYGFMITIEEGER